VIVTIVLVVLAAIAVFVIAAVVIGREVVRLDAEAPRPVFDLDEAVAWIADRLPDEITAVLSADDVAQILEWALECLATAQPDLSSPGGESVVEDEDAVAFVLARARAENRDWTGPQVAEILAQQTAYLEVIGAVRSLSPERGGGPAEDSL
jgi:hypothetical protein